MTGRRGYLVGIGVFVLGFAIAGLQLWRVYAQVQAFPRVEMPGSATLELPSGQLIGYAEPVGLGTLSELSARCEATDAGGKVIALRRATSNVSYSFGSYQGISLLELDIPTAGTITFRCESESKFRVAIGSGIGGGIVAVAVSVFGGSLVGLVIVLLTRRRRRRDRAAAGNRDGGSSAAGMRSA
jgi:hypothetical protein